MRTSAPRAGLGAAALVLAVGSCNLVTGADSLGLEDQATGRPAGSEGSPEDAPDGGKPAAYVWPGTKLSALAGTTGTIWALATYSDGGAHPGTYSIDIGASGGSAVWHQLGPLPPDVAGGWIRVDQLQESGYCSQWNPDDAYYNGAKLRAYTYLYATDGTYIGWHQETFQHVEPAADVAGVWRKWNNSAATVPAWPNPDLTYGNGVEGGIQVGTLFAGGDSPIYNGDGGKLCHWGDHLHQEGADARADGLTLEQSVTARSTGLHTFEPIRDFQPGGPPSAPAPATSNPPPSDPPPSDDPPPGDPPPGDPPPDDPPPSDPPADPPAGDPPADPCGGLTYQGQCVAGVLSWCENGAVQSYDCATAALGCGWQDDAVGFNCLPGCGGLDYAGACVGNSLRWCEAGGVRVADCAALGKACGWQDDVVGFNCL